MTAPHPAVGIAREFIDAIIWGEHSTIWELLSPAGRDRVLLVGSRGGLDSVMAERIRQGTAPQSEMDDFLSGLVRGLRFDLSSADLEAIDVAPDAAALGDALVQVSLEAAAPFHDQPWCVGTIDLSHQAEAWLVDRLEPRLIKT